MDTHTAHTTQQPPLEQLLAAAATQSSACQKGGIHAQLSEKLSDLYALAYQCYEHGKYQKAADFFHVLTRLQSQNPSYWMGLAASKEMLLQYEEALECYSVAALLDIENPTVHFSAAGCCFAMGNIEKGLQAIAAAELVALGKPEHATLISQLALIRDAWNTL